MSAPIAAAASRNNRFFQACVSHPGEVRKANEDSFLARLGEAFWVVADGMGGFEDGRWASSQVVAGLAEAPLSGDLERDRAVAADAIRHANFRIFDESTSRRNKMGTTVAALLVSGDRFAILWAGDSRIYLWRREELTLVTSDHTQLRVMVDAGYLTPAEAEGHPMGHVLARAVGVQPDLELEERDGEALAGDLFLLCSDGLAAVVGQHEIADTLRSRTPAQAVERLLELALARGAPDNVTILAVGCVDPWAAATAEPPLVGGAAAAPDAPPVESPLSVADEPAPVKRRGGALAGALVVILAVVAAGAAGLMLLRPSPRTIAAADPAAVPLPKAAWPGRQAFEAALGGVGCSWVELQSVAQGPAGVDLSLAGVAASPAAVEAAVGRAAADAGLQVADVDQKAVTPAPSALCAVLDALRPYRSDTFTNGQALSAAQDAFAVMKQADGKLAGRAVVALTPPPGEDVSLLELGSAGDLTPIAPSRAALETLAAAGGVVSKVPGESGYRLQVDYPQPGLSGLILVAGRGPFPASLTRAAKPGAAWARQFADAARAGGWRVEMAWYRIVPGGDLSVIPVTAATNALLATNAVVTPPAGKPPPKPPPQPAATNAAAPPPAAAANRVPAAPATNQAEPLF